MSGVRSGVRLAVLAIVLGVLLVAPSMAPAHPLGNFSVNRYSGLEVTGDAIELRYIVDLAEIPTFQEIQESGLTPEASHPSVAAYAARKAELLKENLALSVNGRRLELAPVSRSVIFPPGAGGLPTLKIGLRYRATLEDLRARRIEYRDGNYAERAGWKEIVAVAGSGWRIVESSVPDRDQSRELTDYPTNLLLSPPQTIEAHVAAVREGSGVVLASATLEPPRRPVSAARSVGPDAPAAPREVVAASAADNPVRAPNRQTTPRNAFTELVTTRQLSLGIVLFSLVVAAGFGGVHALEPGHGKTVVAAYLVGARGTAWHALILGLIVTASHTAGVYLLGGVTLYAQRYVVPERLYPWVGVLSGLTIAALGCVLFLRRYAGGHHHGHDHPHDHHGDHHHEHGNHRHHDHDGHHHHHHDHGHRHVPESGEVSLKELFVLGVTGGIVPCPAALVVLLGALSLGRVLFGLVLITAFSVGLAAVLIGIGLLMVYARRLMSQARAEGPIVTRWLPLASSAVMALVGVAIAIQALMAAGIVTIRLS